MADNKPTASAANPAAGKPADAPPAPKLQYVDRLDCEENFADTVSRISFDGQTLRMEFAVTRLDDVAPNTPSTGRLIPIVRLVLPPRTAVDLMNRMQQVTAALIQAGYLKQTPPAA